MPVHSLRVLLRRVYALSAASEHKISRCIDVSVRIRGAAEDMSGF